MVSPKEAMMRSEPGGCSAAMAARQKWPAMYAIGAITIGPTCLESSPTSSARSSATHSATTLHATHVTSIQLDLARKLLLAPASFLPKLPEATAEENLDILHPAIVGLADDATTAYKYPNIRP